jgi:hypothetical protein
MTTKFHAFHWPDHVIGKRESRRIRDEHNALFNSHGDAVRILEELESWNQFTTGSAEDKLAALENVLKATRLHLRAEAESENTVNEAAPTRPPHWAEYCEHVKSRAYRDRVEALESEGCTRSDAQGIAGAEWLESWQEKNSRP